MVRPLSYLKVTSSNSTAAAGCVKMARPRRPTRWVGDAVAAEALSSAGLEDMTCGVTAATLASTSSGSSRILASGNV